MGLFGLFKKKELDTLEVACNEEMNRRQQLADEINNAYDIKANDVVLSENDKLRIDKNCKIMEQLGLPYMREMKLIPLDSNANVRTKEEIVVHMIFDFFVSHKAKNKLNNIPDVSDMDVMFLAMNYPIQDMFNVLSQISKGEIDELTLNQLAYRYEQANVYAWILGLGPKPLETELQTEENLYKIFLKNNTIEDIINKCNMINNEKIMEYADLVTRYEWAMIELRNNNKSYDKINVDCIIEHKAAMDFITCYEPSISIEKK